MNAETVVVRPSDTAKTSATELERGRVAPNTNRVVGSPKSRTLRESLEAGLVSPLALTTQVPVAPRRGSAADLLSRTSVVIPTLNESANLPQLFAEIPEGLHELIIVDGLSTDDTVEVAKSLRPDVRIVLATARGKGAAMKAGFEAATGEIIAMIDADGSTRPAELPAFVAALGEGADVVKGSRYARGGGSDDLTPLRSFGNLVLTKLVNVGWKVDYTDLCYGYMAFWRRHLDVLTPETGGFEVETFLNIRAADAGLKVAEVPSWERSRWHGESNLRVVRDGLRIGRTIVKEYATRNKR